MERNSIKDILIKKGVKADLLEMPAVMERVFEEYQKDGTLDKIEVTSNGELIIKNNENESKQTKIKMKDTNDGALIEKGDFQIETNEVGIEVSKTEVDDTGLYLLTSSNIVREDGEITRKYSNNGDATYYEMHSLDNGHCLIDDAIGEDIQSDNNVGNSEQEVDKVVSKTLNKDDILKNFDEYSNKIIQLYPNTKEWYESIRANVASKTDLHNDPNHKLEYFENQIEKLQSEIDYQEKRTDRLSKMLNVTDDFFCKLTSNPIVTLLSVPSRAQYKRIINSEVKRMFEDSDDEIERDNRQSEVNNDNQDSIQADIEKSMTEKKRLEKELSDLDLKYENVSYKLSESLELVSKIKESSIGSKIFKKKIESFENQKNTIDQGEER